MKNIIWFQIDSFRHDIFELYSSLYPDSFLSRLIRSGHTFDNCISAAPYTLASEVSIFTSLYPHVHGVDGWLRNCPNRLLKKCVTITDILKHAGYSSYCIYESAVRPYVPPFSFDEYHMLSPGIKWPLESIYSAKSPKFIFLQFSGIHDDCIKMKGSYTKLEFCKSILKISNQIENIFHLLCNDEDLVLVGSDHGVRVIDEPEGDHFEYVTGRYLSDKTIKIGFTLIDKCNIMPGKTSHMVRTIDIAPTLLELLDLPSINAQGYSLCPFLEETIHTLPPIHFAFSQTGSLLSSPSKADKWSVRTEDWKFILTKQTGTLGNYFYNKELYCLKSDPHELSNVIDTYPEQAKLLSMKLDSCMSVKYKPSAIYKLNCFDPSIFLRSRTYHLLIRLNVIRRNFLYTLLTKPKVFLTRVRLWLKSAPSS